jgi:hypothetical protein
MSFHFMGQAQSAASTIRCFTSAGDSIVANGAGQAVCSFAIGWLPAVGDCMTFCTKCDAVINYISKFWIFCHWFDMVGMKILSCITLLANVIISFEHFATPMLILICSMIRKFTRFARGSVATFLAAIFRFVPASLGEFAAAKFARKCWGLPRFAATIITRFMSVTWAFYE